MEHYIILVHGILLCCGTAVKKTPTKHPYSCHLHNCLIGTHFERFGLCLHRFMEALRAQLKKQLSKVKQEPQPLCFCAATFWDSHPDTCANNCIFHNNHKGDCCAHCLTDGWHTHAPQNIKMENRMNRQLLTLIFSTAYAKALQSTMVGLDL